MKPKALILSGYGINCERETKHAFELAGGTAEIKHINDLIAKETKLEDYQILVFPGGFSYGDDTGSGNAFANKMRLTMWEELMIFIKAGKLVLGICNGFQILVNLGLLPALNAEYGTRQAALTHNDSTQYECRWVHLKNNSKTCVFTKGIKHLHIPVAHGEGKFFANKKVIEELAANDQIVFTYTTPTGERANGTFPENPNGSIQDIAGICDPSGRILGMMPHPERAILQAHNPHYHKEKEKNKRKGYDTPIYDEFSLQLFRNAVNYIKEKGIQAKGMTYEDAGVNIELGDDVSKILYNAAKQTWNNRKGILGELIVPFDDFSGVRAIDVSNLPLGTLMNIGFDGVGTKMELAERIKDHTTIAYDLFAMVCDDAVVRGAEPVLIGSILDVNALGTEGASYKKEIKELAEGYVNAAKEANVAIVNGEVAELGNRVGGYGPFNYNWGATVAWFANKKKLFTGKEIKIGDSIVAFKEKGFRSNGLSLVRNVLENAYGKNWHEQTLGENTIGKLVLTPSTIYTKTIINAHGGISTEKRAKIHGVAHITGGGIPGKLARILQPSGYGAKLHNLYEAPNIMKHCQKLGNITDEEAYKTWNMGNGMLVITPEPEKIIKIAREQKIEAKIAGTITEEKKIQITHKTEKQKKEIIFE